MGKIVGIICEYNPFHKGHKYQIDQIRQEIPNATIVAIMSGNIVQRGEFALFNKYDRTQAALNCGVNAVFELPYPFSGSTAEIFAKAGVEVAQGLGCDVLCFGTEEHNLEVLEKIAKAVDSEEFERLLRDTLVDRCISYISAKESVFEKMGLPSLKNANDILAVEYIRAIKAKGYNLEYKTVKRLGARYNDQRVCDIMSASAIRKRFYETGEILSVPEYALEIYEKAKKCGKFLDERCAKKMLHIHSVMKKDFLSEFDSCIEISTLLKKNALDCESSEEFFESLSSKTYTASRLKRVILYSVFGVKNVNISPEFTVLLGADEKGRTHLNSVKKNAKIEIITKHSDCKNLSPNGKEQLETLYRVDMLYNTLLDSQVSPSNGYKNKPIIVEK